MSCEKILVAQGGGPTAVINQSLVGVALEARRFSQVSRVYGARHGVRGIINEDFLDLTQETSHNLEMVANTPASALGSTRDKPDLKYCQEIFKVLRAHGGARLAPDRRVGLHHDQVPEPDIGQGARGRADIVGIARPDQNETNRFQGGHQFKVRS